MVKRIVLCADDYGQVPEVSSGILALIQDKRLSATSCLVTGRDWDNQAQKLAPYKSQIEIGLHFNLTDGKPLSPLFRSHYGEYFPSLIKLFLALQLGKLKEAVIEAECHAQLDRFEEALNQLPNFIDGHQHIHQFPIIRNALVNVYAKRLQGKSIYCRYVGGTLNLNALLQTPKKGVIYATSKTFKELLIANKIPHNLSFAGIYRFSRATHYGAYFKRFLAEITDGGIIMCHPGLYATSREDPIAHSREQEYQYFISDQFLADCRDFQVQIGPLFKVR